MSDEWARKLTELDEEIAKADAVVRSNLRKLGTLHQDGLDIADVAGQLVSDLKRLLSLRDQRDEHLWSMRRS